MSRIVKTDASGALTLTPDLLGEAKPHASYVIEADPAGLLVRPEAW